MKTPEEIIDAIANKSPVYWNSTDIIAALDAAGYVIVPNEPTEEMLKAAVEESEQIQSDPCPFWPREFVPIYRAMLAAAPNAKKPPQPEG